MNRIASPSSGSVSSIAQTPDWRDLPVSAKSTDPSQHVTASIAFSVDPAWYINVTDVASRGGKATVGFNKQTFEVRVAPGQLAGTTAKLFEQALRARGYAVGVSGVEKPTPVELAAFKAELSVKQKLLREGNLSGVALYRLQTEIEILESQVANRGYFTLTAQAPK
jgi:hypothetical protein